MNEDDRLRFIHERRVNGSGTGETGEAASPGRCPTVGQGGPGRHPATVRMKWSRDMCYVAHDGLRV